MAKTEKVAEAEKYKTYNLGLAYYRHYYKGWNWIKNCPKGKEYIEDKKEKEKAEQLFFDEKSKPFLNQKLGSVEYKYTNIIGLDQSLLLKTTYPGLLLGTGYAHGIGVQGEHKIGFYFDHTTGLPIVPGSSIKGLLRSAFPLSIKDSEKDKAKANRMAYIKGILEAVGEDKTTLTDAFVQQLELEIFEGKFQLNGERKNIPIAGRDIFFDAFLDGPSDEKFMGNDFITPHKNTDGDGIPDALKNPIPLQFLKVLPGINIRFQFRLKAAFDYQNKEGNWVSHTRLLKPKSRRKLFKQILLDLGIGAKSNVGYGHFIDTENRGDQKSDSEGDLATNDQKKYLLVDRPKHQGIQKPQEEKEVKATFFRGNLNHKKELLMDSVVVESGTPNKVQLYMKEGNRPIVILNSYKAPLEIGKVVQVRVQLKRDQSVNNDAVSYKKMK